MLEAPALVWAREFGSPSYDEAKSVALAPTGVYVAGSTNGALPGGTNAGSTDSFLQKYDPTGHFAWTRQFGTSEPDEARAVAANSSGVYVAGFTLGAFPGETNLGGTDVFVRKIDGNGNAEWTRQFGTSAGDFALAVAADASSVYVTGYTEGTFPGQLSLGGTFISKYDAAGTESWTRQFNVSDGSVHGWAVASDGSNVYAAGQTDGTLPGQTSSGTWDAFVRKYDSSGAEVWTRQFGTSTFELTWAVAADASAVYVAGTTTGAFPGQTATGYDAFMRKYESSGTEAWTRQFGTGTFTEARGVAIGPLGIYVGGFTGGALPGSPGPGETFLRKYDILGTEAWTSQFGPLSLTEASAVAVDTTGAYVAGRTNETFAGEMNAGDFDGFAVRVAETPVAPTNVRASPGDGTIGLTWGPPTHDGGLPVTAFRVHRGTTSGSLVFLVELGTVFTYLDEGLTNGVTYFYTVRAVNAVGEGPASSETSATPVGPDTTAPTVTITSPQDGAILRSTTVTVAGTASDDAAVGQVEVSADGTIWVSASGTTSWSVTLSIREGSNTITARATDTSGNLATTSIMVSVELPAPPPEGAPLPVILLPVGGILIAAVVVILYLLRRRRGGTEPDLGALPPKS